MVSNSWLTKYPDEGLSADGGAMAQIPTYVTTVPDGTEKVCQPVRIYKAVANGSKRDSILLLILEEPTSASVLLTYMATPSSLRCNPKRPYHPS